MENTVAKLFSLLEKKYEQWKGLEDDIGFIKRELRMIDGAMHDQLSQKGDLSAVQSISMEEMRDLAHDIEDCLDRFLPCPACEGEASFLDRLTAAVTSCQFATEIQKLKRRLKEAHQLMSDYNVNGGQPTISGCTTAASSSKTGTTEVELVGMDKPKQELLELLEDVEGQPEQLSVISVVGFGGSGKTTLARAVYDCPDVVGRFPGRAWVVASEHKNDIRGLLSTLLNQLRPEDQRRDVQSGVQQLQQVQTDIRQCLNTKRYLIVFDDIEEQQWDCIKSTFPVQTRSRVIVTTTIRPVANACSYGKGHVYNMRTLDVNHSKDLLEALLMEHSAGLEWDPTPIVEKCDGLPLALVSVANFLRRKNDLTEIYCKQVCRSLGYHMEKEYVFTELRQVLMNNYSNLSGHPLKTCLLYTSVFPNGRPIRRNSLIRRWLAEGYVQCQYPRSDMEVADENFQELIDRNIMRPIDASSNAKVKSCRTHGIMHEFMLHKSMSGNFITSLRDPNRSKFRHLFIQDATNGSTSDMDYGTSPEGVSASGTKQLRARSLTFFGNAGKFASDFVKFELLRVLDLEECNDLEDDYVEDIHKLLHLKYLSLGASITKIPSRIKELHCLETLDLKKTRVETLPVEVIKLPHLAHLFGKIKLSEKDLKMGELQKFLSEKSKLQILAGFVVDKTSAFPQLMVHMKKLKKVKIWCEPPDADSEISSISMAIQKFAQAGLDTTGARSLSLNFRKYSEDFLCSLENSYGYLSSLKLHGEVNRFPQFVTSLCGLRELCLSSTNLMGHDLSNLCTLCHLLYLKLVEADLRDFIIKNGDFPSLRRLCLVVQIPILPTIEQGALPCLVSLQLLCKHLVDLSGIRIEYHDYIEEVVLDSTVSRETIENWENEAKKHPNRPKVSFLKRVDPTDTESTVKYAATEGPTHGTGSSVTLNKRKFHAVQLCSVNELNSALKQRKVSDSSPASTEPSSAGNGATPSSLRDNSPHPPGGFLSFFNNQSQNFHLVGGSSPPLVTTPTSQPDQGPIDVDSGDEVGRTEKRILWTQEEDVRLMSSWLENSTDSTTGADRGGNQHWSDVVDSYNKTTPLHRKRNAKQCKDRWHKINRWTDLFECAYVKARRVFTSGYSDQMWIDAAHKFYLVDNKEAKLGPFVLIEVWKMCRDVAKWKTYNEELKNARKRKAYHHEGQEEENDESLEEMPKRPIGQKAAKKAALAAKGKSKALDDGGKSKESAIDVEKLDKFSKIQEEANANRIKVLELQQKLYSDKLETTRLAHLTAQENKESKKLEMERKKFEKESKMMEAYNNLVSQDTSSMTDEEKAERVAAMKCFRKTLFPEII